MSTHDYVIIVHPDENGGFWTDVPSLPGCGSQGETVDEAVEMTKDAILGYLESLKKHGNPPPSESAIVVKVTIAA
ncbi:MAG TPA: type II toxin-antitoxin system HicB family antitoxin [Dehalococcoidia bacterium]|jgi:predicted RNase H-like HicB family nuclease|nr:type II toxin-antitoxin system HicB family antitoxin [Dehalococcoidia bacterium]